MDLDLACLQPIGSVFEEYHDRFVVVNQFRSKAEYAYAFMASPPGLDSIFYVIFDELPLNMNKEILEATGGLLLQYHILVRKSSVKGK